MIIVLVGRMASGKTTLKEYIVERSDFTIEPIITYTTRPKRSNEKDGVDYKFITEEEFEAMSKLGWFIEETEYNAAFGHCRYGSAYSDYTGEEHKVVVLNPEGTMKVAEDPKINSFVIWLDYPEEVLMKRALGRGDKPVEINRRFMADQNDFSKFKFYGKWNLRITNPAITNEALFETILDVIEGRSDGRENEYDQNGDSDISRNRRDSV